MAAVTGFVARDRLHVLLEAVTGDLRLDHPESVAVGPDGSIWCGGEQGQIYRIAADGSSFEQVASTGGFCLGLAFDRDANLFVCDIHHRAVMRLDGQTFAVENYADGVPGHKFRMPNYPAFGGDGRLYISDSWGFGEPGPGIACFDVGGEGQLWYDKPLGFANAIALSRSGSELYVVETFAQRVSAIAVRKDGTAGERRTVAATPGCYPDGLAVDAAGAIWVGCYEPSQLLRVTDEDVAVAYRDETAHLLAHPTGLAFHDTTLIVANLGRWHLTTVDLGVEGLALPPASTE